MKGISKISDYFDRSEFKCKCGKCRFEAVDSLLLYNLLHIRDYWKTPIIIISGIRCAEYNKKIGGAPDSMHIYGLAADFYPKDSERPYHLSDIYNYIDKLHPNEFGLGLYKTWIHLDVRKEAARWKQNSH